MKREHLRILDVDFDRIQQAMEDITRDALDYYFDRRTGEVVALEKSIFDHALRTLYHTPPPDEPEEDILFDSEINLAAELPDHLYDSLEKALAVTHGTSRYIRIPERESSEAFDCMRRFAEEVSHPVLRESLVSVLDGKKSFRKFKDSVAAYPEERKQWHVFNARRMREVIRQWLRGQGISPVRKRTA